MFPMHTVQTILEILPVLGRHNFQHHTGEKRLDPRQQNESAGDQRRESRHQSRIQNTGANNITDTTASKNASMPKKCMGL